MLITDVITTGELYDCDMMESARLPRRHFNVVVRSCPLCASAQTLDSILDGSSTHSVCGSVEVVENPILVINTHGRSVSLPDFFPNRQCDTPPGTVSSSSSDTDESRNSLLQDENSVINSTTTMTSSNADTITYENEVDGSSWTSEEEMPTTNSGRILAKPIPIPPRPDGSRRLLNVTPTDGTMIENDSAENEPLPCASTWADYYDIMQSCDSQKK